MLQIYSTGWTSVRNTYSTKFFDGTVEIQRSFEKGLPSKFLELYEELKDQTEESEEEESK